VKEGLYFLPAQPSIYSINITMDLLYQRFAHINKQNLQNLVKNTITNNHYKQNNNNCSECEVCAQAELPNKRNKESNNKIQYNYIEKISSNLCGPFRIKTHNKKSYFITFLDKKSRYLKAQLLANKTEVLSVFLEYKAKAENNIKGYKIRVFQCDNRTEYKHLLKYLTKEGIIIQLSPPYTHECNGLPERINRTIMVKVRAVLIQSNAPKYLWGEAL